MAGAGGAALGGAAADGGKDTGGRVCREKVIQIYIYYSFTWFDECPTFLKLHLAQ